MPKRTGRPPGLTPDGPKIRRLRIERGLTTRELGEQVGRHSESIRAAENSRPISAVFASRLARALGVTMRDISNWDGGDGNESRAETKIPA